MTGIAVFDGRVAWYGTLPLLAFAKADDCCLRVESAEVAVDLENALEGSALPPALADGLDVRGQSVCGQLEVGSARPGQQPGMAAK